MAKHNNLTVEEKAILVSRIEPYMEKFTKFYRVGHIRLTDAESKELASMMRELNPRYNFNYKLNCNSCIRETVTSLSNFYSRERSKVEFPLPSETLKEDNEESPATLYDTAKVNEALLTTEQDSPDNESEEIEVVKDEAYYESLDKRSKEYREYKESQNK